MPKIAFNAIFELTETYHQIAGELAGKADCFFITPDIYTFERLRSYGVPENRILDLAITRTQLRGLPPPSKEVAEKALRTEFFGPTFASLISMSSRFYEQKEAPQLYRYLYSCSVKVEDFIKSNGISWVFAEPTTAPELISYSVCRKLGINAANISIIRHPVGRCAIFGGIGESSLYPLTPGPGEMSAAELGAWLREFREHGEKPLTFDGQSRQRSPLSLLRSALRRTRLTQQEMTGTNQLNYTNFITQAEILSRRYRSPGRKYDRTFDGRRFSADPRPYIVYFIHVQPERTIDVMAPRNSNQLEVIRQLRMALPSSVKLVVKEHPSAYGTQPPEFYRGLENTPDVSLIEARHNTFRILQEAVCAVTLTGTVGMDAALLDTPAVVLSDVFFCDMPNVHKLSHPGEIRQVLPQILGHVKGAREAELLNYLRGLVRNSHPSDWQTLGGLHPSETIKQLTALLMRAINFSKQGNNGIH